MSGGGFMMFPEQSYESQAQALFTQYGRDVAQFSRGYKRLVQEGEKRLRHCQATGYNILLNRQDLDIISPRDLIFYSEAIYHPQHFGVLLTTMEQEGLIKPYQIRFGVRSSTVLISGVLNSGVLITEWKTDADKRFIIRKCRKCLMSYTSKDLVPDFLETVITFSPDNRNQARQIADFLDRKTQRRTTNAIIDSPAIPDIRATPSLQSVLPRDRFALVRANIFSQGESQLIILRQRERLDGQSWENAKIVINRDLVAYLARFGVRA
jgi:hypothetical protein